MKKHLLCLSLITAPLFAGDAAPDTIKNACTLVEAEVTTSLLDLPFWSAARVVGLTTLGSAFSWLGTRAFINIFQAKRREHNILDVSSWSLPEKIVTPCAFGVLGKVFSDAERPEVIAKNINEDGLLDLILNAEDKEALEKALDLRFAAEPLPRTAAFSRLTALRQQLKSILDFVTTAYKTKAPLLFTKLSQHLIQNIAAVDTALIIIKGSPRWIEEYNAQTFKRAQATQQSHHNAQLAGAVVDLAHAYAKSR